MAEIVNLNLVRKGEARKAAKAQAAQNRASHGLPKAEREGIRRASDVAARTLDAKKREP